MGRLTLEDWYELCDRFKAEAKTGLVWDLGFGDLDYDDTEALKINRGFVKIINSVLQKKEAIDVTI